MITQRDIKVATASVAEGKVPKIELKDDGPRGGGRLTLAIRPKECGVTSEWYAVWHHDGQRKSTKLGSHPGMSLKEARDLFRTYYQSEILDGRDPVGPRRWARGETVTVEEMFGAYVDNLKKRGAKSADRVSVMLLGPNGVAQSVGPKRRPADITPDDLVPYFKKINDRGSIVLANDVRAFTRAAFQYGITSRHSFFQVGGGTDWGLKANPLDAIPSNPDARKARDRVLSAMEIRSLWDWCVEKESKYRRYRLCATLRLIIATGQRPTEIYRIDKAGYDTIEQALHWKTTKNKRPHDIPLPLIAVEIMDQLSPNEHGLYFWRKFHPAEHLGFDALRQITETYLEETGAEHFQLRDLRRTWKTLTGKLGVSKEIRDRLQNHALKDVSSKHYDRYDYWQEKVDAMQRWDQGLRAILAANHELSINELRSTVPALMAPNAGIVDAEFEVIEEEGDQRPGGIGDKLPAVSGAVAPSARSDAPAAYFQPQLI